MIAADYFDGRSSRRQPVTLGVQGRMLVVEGEFGRRTAPLDQVEIDTGADAGPSTIRFADGALCEIRDRGAFATELAGAGVAASVVTHAEKRWSWALATLAGAALVIAAIYAYLLPWVAELLAPRIPQSMTQAISDSVLQGLDGNVLAPSKLPQQRQQEIAGKVAALGAADHGLPPYRLLFRSGAAIGPNAFALPGGDVVVLDELVALAGRDEDVVAVVAHELGHLHYRHGMRQIIQSSVVSFVVGVYLGDVSSVVAGLTALVLDSRYSREFEREADAYAGQLLTATPRGVEPLISMLQRLEEAHGKRRVAEPSALFDVFGLLSTHPDTAGRIAALRAMSSR